MPQKQLIAFVAYPWFVIIGQMEKLARTDGNHLSSREMHFLRNFLVSFLVQLPVDTVI